MQNRSPQMMRRIGSYTMLFSIIKTVITSSNAFSDVNEKELDKVIFEAVLDELSSAKGGTQ